MRYEQKCSQCVASIVVLDVDDPGDLKEIARKARAAGWRFVATADGTACCCSDCPDPAPRVDPPAPDAVPTTKKRGK